MRSRRQSATWQPSDSKFIDSSRLMAIEISVPRLGWNMDVGVFVAWLKQEGDVVQAGEALFSLETDKAVQEVESLDSGRLRIAPDAPKPGETVGVGTVIGSLDPQHEFEPGPATRLSAAAVRRGSPRARRKASELGIDLSKVAGTGSTGRIRERDVLAAAGGPKPHARSSFDPVPDTEFQIVPIDSTRRAIAEHVMQAAHSTAPVTLSTSIDATNLVNLRQQFKAVAAQPGSARDAVIGYTDITIKLAALALQRHPALNSRCDGERILIFRGIHVGLAVDTTAGLMVPVIRNVPGLSLRQVAACSRELIDRARRRALIFEEMQGGTFTITNLGSFGVDTFTPILNAPQCAVLGMGRIARHVVVHDQTFAARERMTLNLTFDHRLVDGAPAARFLQTLAGLLENPSAWLLP
jgi:pyruvate dehydrogenase E2 component (dihydrolipoamide acetyltransferase)